MKRRTLLATGLAGISSLSGCSAAKDVIRTGPPHFEDVRINGPDSVTVGEDFTLEISARNTGGRAGDFTATLTVGSDSIFTKSTSVTIKNVAIDEQKSTSLGPLSLNTSQEVAFRITDHGAKHTVSSTPATVDVGSSFTSHGVKLTVEDLQYRTRFLHRSSFDGPSVPTAPGQVFAFVKVSAEVLEEGSSLPQPDDLSLVTGSATNTPSDDPIPPDLVEGKYSPPFTTEKASAGGWVPFRVRPENLQKVKVEWKRTGESTDVIWSASGSPPALPEFEVGEASIPDRVEIGRQTQISFPISNSGDGDGTYYGLIERKKRDRWEHVMAVSKELAAGDEKSINVSLLPQDIGEIEYRLMPDDVTATVDVQPPILSFGEFYQGRGAQVTVERLIDGFDSYTYFNGSEKQTVEAESGQQYVFAHLTAKNSSEEEGYLPGMSSFAVDDGSTSYAHTYPFTFSEISLKEPVEGQFWEHTIQPGTHSAWIVFEVPSSVSSYDLDVTMTATDSNSDRYLVTWQSQKPNNG